MVNNFLFEVEHYGAVLNANRTYYLTRSQPPFLTSMILGVYEAQQRRPVTKIAPGWPKPTQQATRSAACGPRSRHLAGHTGLSRYISIWGWPRARKCER